ncbi:MAG: hypothetical protein RIQ93_2107 [Verrucomicrobiota bacterium]|jgi:uncharacterized protein (DUF2062 family)
MNFRWMMRRLHGWGFSRRKLRGGFLHARLGDRILHRELWIPTRTSLALAFLIGMPVTTIPFLPLQSVIACFFGFLAGANLPVCFLLQFLSTPATAVIQLPACYLAGELILGGNFVEIYAQLRAHPMMAVSTHNLWALYLGSFALGPFLGILGYFGTKLAWRERPKRHRGPRHPHVPPMPHKKAA